MSSKGRVLDLRLDDEQGTSAHDYSRYSNDGALTGCKWVEHGLEFNGSSDYVDCGNADIIKPANFSVCFWFNSNDLTGVWYGDYIISNGKDYNNAYGYGITAKDDILTFWVGNNTVDRKNQINTPIVINTWYSVVATYQEGVGSKLYVDSNLKTSSGAFTGSIVYDSSVLNIGKLKTTYYHFNGSIDDVRIHNRALSAAEIYDEYEATKHRYK